MFYIRTLAVWLLLIFVESVHGTLRQMFLAPLVGDFTARRIAFFVALGLILAVALLTIRWLDAPSRKSLYVAGLIWMILTASFEFLIGRFVMNLSWDRIFEDYDVTRGGLMAFGLLFLVFAPAIAIRIRGK
ncbi:MAG: hypothetical protein IPK58_02110 [Acidobacteria bacterium]|nr:hypothetical protein [Acidobacteriota bacterium]